MPRPEGPLDPDAGVVQRFAWELRRLREKAGGPTYRELVRRTHYSQATLAKAAGGRDFRRLGGVAVYGTVTRADDGGLPPDLRPHILERGHYATARTPSCVSCYNADACEKGLRSPCALG
jgi:hypothetical protein